MSRGGNTRPGSSNQLRIIGGEWRSRRLRFPSVPGLRPSSDRGRETLFNWLQPIIAGARCLDLFAGSGALGLESLSRGAAEVVFVDTHPKVIAALKENLALLQAGAGEVVRSDALDYLQGQPRPFDIVFLDPPFRQNLLEPCLHLLDEGGWLAAGAYVYIEHERELPIPVLPEGWSLLRSKEAGQVCYHLVQIGG